MAPLDPEERAELERRLGMPFSFDGSFSSLWAVELVLRAVRLEASFQPFVGWVQPYVRSILTRAYTDSGLMLLDLGPDVLSVMQPAFISPIGKAVRRMITQAPPAAGSSMSPVFGMALAPRYGLEAISLGQPRLELSMSKHRRELERLIDWLARDQLGAALPESASSTEALSLVRAFTAPSFGYVANGGTSHLSALTERWTGAPHRSERVLEALMETQDRYLSTLAARLAMEVRVRPKGALSALAMLHASQHFSGPLPVDESLYDELSRLVGTRDPSASAECKALLERASSKSHAEHFDEADAHLFEARALVPFDPNIRAHLLANHFRRRAAERSQQPATSIAAPSAASAPSRPTPDSGPSASAPSASAPLRKRRAPTTATYDEWGQYKILELLGAGGMGKVHRVHHRGWGIDLALKIPRVELLERGGVSGFIEEAEAWARLGVHPHTVACFYVRMRDGVPWLFAEYVDGGSLADYIAKGTLLEPAAPGEPSVAARLVDVALQIAYGLEHAHVSGLIHQDMKPANVILTKAGVAKVTDFGLAKVTRFAAAPKSGSEGAAHHTMVAGYAGMTPLYCSPEQSAARRSKKRVLLTRRTDVWSWGLTVLEMFTGHATWRSGVLAPVALRQYRERGATDPRIPPMPDALHRLLERCFQGPEADRPQSMLEIATELRSIYASLGAGPGRVVPDLSGAVAVVLNNRAASLLDLGRPADAEKTWRRALAAEPHHLEATYNLALHQWRESQISDLDAIGRIEAATRSRGASRRSCLLEAWLHYERAANDDLAAALERMASFPPPASQDRLPPPPKKVEAGVEVSSLAELPDDIEQLATTPDGSVVAASTEQSICLIRTADGERLGQRSATATHIAVGPRGQTVVMSEGKKIRAWHVSGPETFAVSVGEINDVLVATFGWLIAAVDERLVTIALATGAVQELGRHEGEATSVASLGDRLVASASADGTVHLRLPDGQLMRTLRHERRVDWMNLAPDGKRAVTGSWDAERSHYRLSLWDTASGSLIRRLEEPSPRRAVLVDGGRHVVSWKSDGTLRVWNVESGRCLRTLRPVAATAITYASEPDVLLAAHAGHLLRLDLLYETPRAPVIVARPRDAETLQEEHQRLRGTLTTLEQALASGALSVAIESLARARQLPGYRHHQGALDLADRVVEASLRGPLQKTWQERALVDQGGPVVALGLTEDRQSLVNVVYDEGLRVIEVRCRELASKVVHLTRTDEDAGRLDAATANAAGVVATCCGGALRVWPSSGPHYLVGSVPGVVDLALGGEQLFVASADGVQVYDLVAKRWLAPFEIKGVTDVCVHAASDTIAIAANHGAPALWSIQSRSPRRALFQRRSECVSLSPNGTSAACIQEDHVLVADLRGPDDVPIEPRRVTLEHSCAIAASAEGDVLVVGTTDGSVWLIDLSFVDTPVLLGKHDNAIRSIAITGDARLVASGGQDGDVRVFRAEYQRLCR